MNRILRVGTKHEYIDLCLAIFLARLLKNQRLYTERRLIADTVFMSAI